MAALTYQLEPMRRAFDAISASGRVVIGEGHKGDVDHLFVGEIIGSGEASDGELDVAVAQLLENRDFVRDADYAVPLTIDAAGRDAVLRDGVQVSRPLDLRPTAQQVRIIVRDTVTGTVGSLFIDADRIRRIQRDSVTIASAPGR